MLNGDVFEQQVVNVFGNNTMASFFTSKDHCDNHHTRSVFFSSRLRDSMSWSTILEYLLTELEEEQNCAKFWDRIKQKLSTADVKVARMRQDWHNLFGLKYEDIDPFPSFYSSSKKIIHNLEKFKSIVVLGNIFLKSYFAKVIQTPELQHEVKKLLKGGKESYGVILEMIHSDYNAHLANTSMRDKTKLSGILCQAGKIAHFEVEWDKVVIPRKELVLFPNSTNHLLPSHYYSQLKAG